LEKLATRPSKTPPTSTQYEIVDRIPGVDGFPTYIVREVTQDQTPQDCSVVEEKAARKHESGSEGSECKVAKTVLNPIDHVHKGPLNRNPASVALGRQDRSSTPQSTAPKPPISASGSVSNDSGTIQVPFTQIRSYVSPLQLERFENFRFRNPKPDDLPYKISTPPSLGSERESLAMEREIKSMEWLSNKRRKLDGHKEVVPRMNPSTKASGTVTSIDASSKASDQGDDDTIGIVMYDNGTDELLKGLPTISPDQPRYELVKRRSFSKSQMLRESTTTSSTSDILNPRLAPSQIAQNGIAEYLAQRSSRSCSAAVTSSVASSFDEKQESRHPFSAAIKHRRRRKKKSLTTRRQKRQPPTPQAPQAEIEENPSSSSDHVYEVSRILTHDYVDKVRYYQVSWTSFPETEENLTWLTEEELQGAPRILKRYLKDLETGIDDSNDEGNEIREEDSGAIKIDLAEGGIV
jgi:hypothetical protein